MANETNGKISFASEQNIGRSRQRGALEDRMRVEEIQTAGGLALTLAVVADGVGGGNYGERAAQLVIDTVFEVVHRAEVSRPEQLPALLNQALVQANRAIFQEANQNKQVRGMGSTATIVAIHNNQLYLANAGDSRAYLIRAKQVYQLTRDHTWANEMVQLGRLTPDKAQAHPKAHELVRSVGFENDLKVDLGLYAPLGQNGDVAAQGLPLQTGDRLVVCSDGLIKERHDAPGNYVEPAEMGKIVTTMRPAAAVKALVQQALDREVDDNVSAIVLETAGSRRAFALPRPVPYIVVGLLLLACLAFGAMRLLGGGNSDSTATPVSVADNGPVAPTATATLRPTPQACQAAVFEAAGGAMYSEPGSGFQPLVVGKRLSIGQGSVVQAGDGPLELVLSDGSQLFVAAGSELGLNQAAGCGDKNETVLQLNRGQMVVDLTGAAGHLVTIRNPLGGQVQSDGGLFGVAYYEVGTLFEVDCFGGTCNLKDIGGELSLSSGQYSRMGGAGVPSQPEPARSDSYCELATRIIPCPTATPTGVPTLTPSVTWTPEPTGTPRPTNTPLPAPTFTPSPTPSITPSPSTTPSPTATLPPGVTPSITPTTPPPTTPPPTTPPPTTPPPTTPPPTTPPPTTPPPTTPPPTTPPPTTPPPTTPPPTTPPPTTPPPTTPPPTTPPPTPTPTETRGTPPTPTPSDTPIPPTETRVPTETPPPPPTPCENPPCP